MQTLHQELDPTHTVRTTADHPVFREMMADPAVAYAEEIRALRQRVALLEAELAASKATVAPARHAPPPTSTDFASASPERQVSEFTESAMPAVMAVQPAAQAPPTAEVAPTPVAAHAQAPAEHVLEDGEEPIPNPGFAQAWTAEDSKISFEERVAEKAFFQASSIDDESRSWLLEH